jgi:hypothetical protein
MQFYLYEPNIIHFHENVILEKKLMVFIFFLLIYFNDTALMNTILFELKFDFL